MNEFINSFRLAVQGIRWGFKGRNLRIQILIGLMVVVLVIAVEITRMEWLVILVFISLATTFEIMDTTIEEVVNFGSSEFSRENRGSGRGIRADYFHLRDHCQGYCIFALPDRHNELTRTYGRIH